MKKDLRPKTVYDRVHYAKKFYRCLIDKDFKPLLDLTKDQRAHCMNALSSLSKFLGMHDEFSALIKKYGLKWNVRSDDLIIARFTKTVDPDDIFNWIKQVKNAYPEMADFMDLMAISGLRYDESVECYNLIIELSEQGKLNEYFDSEREILEHYKFKDIFLRRTKKAFISFVPKDLISRISRKEPLNIYTIQTRVKRQTGKLRFGDIREIHGTLLTKQLNEIEINFLHGRISSSVFMRNYYNANLIGDLRQRTFKATKEILDKIS